MLLSIGGEVYGPTINAALNRDEADPRLAEAARETMSLWVSSQEEGHDDD